MPQMKTTVRPKEYRAYLFEVGNMCTDNQIEGTEQGD